MERVNELTLIELILLQKHIELGRDHLLEVLGKKGFRELLQFGKMSQGTVDQIKIDEAEIVGNLILAVNAVITACFGGWMGLSAMMGFPLDSPSVFGMVLFFAILLGTAIAYQNFLYVKREEAQTVQTLQMLHLEEEILREIFKRRRNELYEILKDLQITNNGIFHPKEEISLSDPSWIRALGKAVEEKLSSYDQSHPLLKKKLASIRAQIKMNFEKRPSEKDEGKDKRGLPLPIKILIHSLPSESKTSRSWIRRNSRKIIVSLVPTLLGGFSSLFVYLSSSTQLAQAFGSGRLVAFLTSPSAKSIKLAISILATLYFGFSFLYTSRRSYKRSIKIETKRETVIKEKSALTLLEEQLIKLRQIHEDIEKIREIFLITPTSS